MSMCCNRFAEYRPIKYTRTYRFKRPKCGFVFNQGNNSRKMFYRICLKTISSFKFNNIILFLNVLVTHSKLFSTHRLRNTAVYRL